MKRRLGKLLRGLVLLLVLAVVAFGLFLLAGKAGWLSVVGIRSETNDSQVVQAIERTQEIALVSLNIEGITDRTDTAEIFGQSVPGTEEQVFVQYTFDAKLGIDGTEVDVAKTSAHAYRIVVPEYEFIGYDQPSFKVATEDGGLLSWVTPDIDKLEMVNEILDEDAQQQYLEKNQAVLEDQTQVFYDSLVTSIDPDAEVTYEFQS